LITLNVITLNSDGTDNLGVGTANHASRHTIDTIAINTPKSLTV